MLGYIYVGSLTEYRIKFVRPDLTCTAYACCAEGMNNVELYLFVCVELIYIKKFVFKIVKGKQ